MILYKKFSTILSQPKLKKYLKLGPFFVYFILQIFTVNAFAYDWSLGDLSVQSTRLPISWETGAWANAVDTEAELVALGWSVTTIRAANCAATNDAADEVTIAAQISAACGGAPPRSCGNRILRFENSCHYDVTAGAGNADGAPAVNFGYSDVAFVGGGMNSTFIDCTDSLPALDATAAHNPCVANASGGDYGHPTVGGTFTWEASTGGQGRGSNASTNALIATGATCSTSFAPGFGIRITGVDSAGGTVETNSYVVASAQAGADCRIQIATPLYETLTPVTLQRTATATTSKTYVIGLSISFVNLHDGAQSAEGHTYGSAPMRVQHSNDFLITKSRLGRYGFTALDLRSGNIRPVIKSNEFGPCQKCKRRGNNSSVMGGNSKGGALVFINNNMTGAAKRMAGIATSSSWGSWFGFNYQDNFLATTPGETGNHCNGVGNPQGIPMNANGPSQERSIFIGHDPDLGDPGKRVGGFLIEANDLNCKAQYDGGGLNAARYSTYFRNRMNRTMGTIENGTTTQIFPYQNFLANRFNQVILSGANQGWNNALGWNNAGTTRMSQVTSPGSIWPITAGAGENWVSGSSPHRNYPLTIPPSLALKTGNAPDWWCRESGVWDGEWNFGAGDGYGGFTYKLPAQIRAEGGTCTPTTPSLSMPGRPRVAR